MGILIHDDPALTDEEWKRYFPNAKRVTYGSTSFVAVDRSGDGQVIIAASDSDAGTVAVKLDKVQAKAIVDLILAACR